MDTITPNNNSIREHNNTCLTSMTHEIKTPLTAIIGMIELARNAKNNDEILQYIDIAYACTRYLNSVVDNNLDYNRLQNNDIRIENKSFFLRDLLHDIKEVFYYSIDEKDLQYNLKIDDSMPNITFGDENRIRQIIYAFVFHFINHMKESRDSLYLYANWNEDSSELCLYYSGEKVADFKDILSNLNETDQGIKKLDNTHLGLSIAFHLLLEINGSAEFDKDSRLKVAIPLKIKSDEDLTDIITDEKDAADNKNSYTNIHILIAEDNPVNLKLLKAILRKEGYHNISWAHNGSLAIDKMKKEKFDLVLMDIEMPVMNGIEATRMIREGKAGDFNKKTIIIATTANAFVSQKNECLNAGMNDFVSKPINMIELNQKILKRLSLKQDIDT